MAEEKRLYDQAIQWTQKALATSALHEELHQTLMRLHALTGDRAAALQHYTECEAMLKREMNLAPMPETQALYEKISRGEPLSQKTAAPAVSQPGPQPNLPRPLSSFIGRKKERAEIKRWLAGNRLVTLTGVGGSGKTRMALRVATDLMEEKAYADGVWWVELAALVNPKLVPQTVAFALGLRDEPGRPLLAALSDYLQSKQLLLILDNCEHLIEACAQLVDALLRACPNLRVLSTSREILGLTGEAVWKMPPLLFPDLKHLPSGGEELLTTLHQYEAVQLFVERAVSGQPAFEVTEQNARSVVEVCRQLDGIPLAIELAAARVRILTVEQIVARLQDCLGLLTQGSRTALLQQQTLRATMDWSYRLLPMPEQILFRRLSVFLGGWTLETAEAVCASELGASRRRRSARADAQVRPRNVLDLLSQLVNKSLVNVSHHGGGGIRYHLLETVRQYAQEKLGDSDESMLLRGLHSDFFLRLAERAEPKLQGAEQEIWLERLELEHDNLRAALLREDGEKKLRLAGALWRFWFTHGHLSEGRGWLEKSLEGSSEASASVREKALNGAGVLAYEQGDYGRANSLYEESLALRRQLGNKRGIAGSLNNLGVLAYSQGDYQRATRFYEESLALKRELGDKRGIATTLNNLGEVAQAQEAHATAQALYEESLALYREMGLKGGMAMSLNNMGEVARVQGNYATARSLYEQSLALTQELGDKRIMAVSLNNLGEVAKDEGDLIEARSLYEQSLAVSRELGDRRVIATTLSNLGDIAQIQGNHPEAYTFYRESLARSQELGAKPVMAKVLQGLAKVACAQGQPARAGQLLGAVRALQDAMGARLDQAEYDRQVDAMQAAMSEDEFAKAWAQGRALTVEQAIAYALAER